MTKVLLVEDDNNLREIYEARLQAEGYQIASASDGEEALVMAKSERPDLIISDVMMPKISGFEMLDILRNTQGLENTKIIMLTALGQSDDQSRANQLGADRYLVKSQVTLEDIVKAAREVLGDETPSAGPTPTDNGPAAPTDSPTLPSDPVSSTDTNAPADNAGQPPQAATPLQPEPSNPAISTTLVDTATQSAAQEEADVKQQIENFISQQPAGNGAADSAAASDDQVLSAAVDTLVADTTPPEPAVPTVPKTAPEVSTPADGDPATMGHKKVIQPIEEPPKTPIEDLVALEEAKGTGATAADTTASPAYTDQTPPHTPGNVITPSSDHTGSNPGFNPNNVAL